MKQTTKLTLAAASIALSSSVAAAAPAWCSKAHKISDSDASSALRHLNDGRPVYMLISLVDVTCHPTAEIEQNAAAIDKARAAWGAKLGLTTDADWADAAEWTNVNPSWQEMVKDDVSTKDVAKLTPIDQYLIVAHDFVSWKVADFDALDMFEPHVSEVGRFALIEHCVGSSRPGTADVIEAIACQPDVEGFDTNKFFAELRSDAAHPAGSRISLRLRMVDLAADLAAYKTRVAKLKKLDEAYVKAFELAGAARGAWLKAVGSNASLLAAVQQAETAHFSQSRKALDACDQPTYAALTAAAAKVDLSKLPAPKDKKGKLADVFMDAQMSALLDDPELNVAASGVIACGHRHGLSNALSGWMPAKYRGPRSMADAMIARAHLQPDNKDDREERRRIGLPDGSLEQETEGQRTSKDPLADLRSGGVLKSVTKTADALELHYLPIVVTYEACTARQETNKVEQVRSDGTVVYRSQCTASRTASTDESLQGAKVDLRYGSIVKAGVRVALVGGGEVAAVWANASQLKPSWLFGAVRK